MSLCTALIVAMGAPWSAAAQPPEAPPRASAREEAIAHFDKGLVLYDRGAFGPALAEFVEARRLFPLHNAVYQAGLCLEKLQRYDEALDRYEAALRELGEATPARVKESLQRKVVEMRGLVGEIAVVEAEPGATVTVDGLGRGEYPLLSPLRVAAGSHLVRVSKVGFSPFEARVAVAGGKTEQVAARLVPLGPTGRVRIVEQGGRRVDVLVDGARVGVAPWEGPLAPGPHMAALRGEGNLGTPPVEVRVEVDRTTPLTLVAEELGAALRVQPVPVNAALAIDGVNVGNGVWEGRLRTGEHRIEVSAQGFLATQEEVTIARDEQREIRVELRRDPRSTFARRPSRFTVEAVVAPAFSPLFGGEVGSGCTEGCASATPAGGYALVRGGYELGSGLGIGISAGYFAATQRIAGRSTSLTAVGHPAEPVVANDSIWLHAGTVGVWAGYAIDLPLPLHLGLGAGAILGSASDLRSGSATPGTILPSGELHPFRGGYLAPAIRVGLFTRGRLEISAGIEMLVAFAPPTASWNDGQSVVVDRSPTLRELATFPTETFAGPILAVLPGLGARYAF